MLLQHHLAVFFAAFHRLHNFSRPRASKIFLKIMADIKVNPGLDDDTSGDDPVAHCSADTPPRKRVRKHYKTKWQQAWSSKYPCITKMSDTQAKCTVCSRAFSYEHQGERDLVRHVDGLDHRKRAKDLGNFKKIDKMFDQKDDGKQVTVLTICHENYLFKT